MAVQFFETAKAQIVTSVGSFLFVLAGSFSVFLVAPTIAGATLERAYSTTNPASLASTSFSFICWFGFATLMFAISVALIAKIDERVRLKSAKSALNLSAVFGPLALVAGAFLIPNAASNLAFSALSILPVTNQLSVAIVSLFPALLTASLVLYLTGMWLNRLSRRSHNK